MEMYKEFLDEFSWDELIESEIGWVQYRYLNENQAYIVNIFVKEPYRRQKAATALADIVAMKAKESGRNELLGTVVPSARNSTRSIQILLGYGMSLKSAEKDLIIFSKGL